MRKNSVVKSFFSFQPARIKRLLWRGAVFLVLVFFARFFWRPGLDITDGRHDRRQNALWLQHGWIGADSWFVENDREWKKPLLRGEKPIRALGKLCAQNGIRDVFPHLCPTQSDGAIMPVDDAQLALFLKLNPHLRVMPWIGGPLDSDILPENAARNQKFFASVRSLFRRHPTLAGVHLNVEPWPSGNAPILRFLEGLRGALPKGKILSVAAYPPPSRLHPFPEIHWEKAYFQQVATRCDQMAVMLYDTSLQDPKMFEWLCAQWVTGVLEWTKNSKTEILLGVATYDDANSGYHHPRAENMQTSLRAIHRGLSRFDSLPKNYAGAAIYSEWETDASEWEYFRGHFRAQTPR